MPPGTRRDDSDPGIAALSEIRGADELCRHLARSTWGWGSSPRSTEAVDPLARVRGTGDLPDAFLAMLICTCQRWNRVTAKLVAAIEDSGVLDYRSLDELAESFLSEEVVIEYPYLWACPEGLAFDASDDEAPAFVIDERTTVKARRHAEPPMRRWAAARALRHDPKRLDGLLACTRTLPLRHRDAALHGLLDSAGALEEDDRRQLVRLGLRCGAGPVRRSALDRLCELDGPDAALHRAQADADRSVRAWQPRIFISVGRNKP